MMKTVTALQKLVVIIIQLLFVIGSDAQLTIHITSIPPVPSNPNIFIAGSFNSWNPGSPQFQLSNEGNGIYSITFSPPPGLLEYKFTRGNWETVEGTVSGNYIPNRTYNYNGTQQALEVTIAGWEDAGSNHTATDDVQILDDSFYMPQLERYRRIWLYLPPDYATTAKKYPVLYLQDGQNLFDAFYSFAGEWEIDESMNELFNGGDYGAIVVGIDNGSSHRIDEYSPWINPNYGGGEGAAYASFLVNTLKPYIDEHFRTLPGRDYTGIGGSSLGANISMFAAVEYQAVFGKVGIFSPAFWFSDSIYQYIVNKGIQEELHIYFIAGTNESSTMISDMQAVRDTLTYAGVEENDMHFISSPDGAHSEWFWAREYPDAYEWLFDGLVLSTKWPVEKKGYLFPNPANQMLCIKSDEETVHVTVYSITGTLMKSETAESDNIDISELPQGIYFIEIKPLSGEGQFMTRFVKQ
jgi:predicted alpha/beta superfamily hydrolase